MQITDKPETIWAVAGAISVLALLSLIIVFVLAPKNVDYYYLSHGAAQSNSNCVYAHWTWHTDEIAFCTDDYQRALDFTTRANASLKGDLHK